MESDGFNTQLLSSLDGLLANESFSNITGTGEKRGIQDRAYQCGNYGFALSLGGYTTFQNGGKKLVGSSMDFTLEGIMPNELSEEKYWQDIQKAIRGAKQEISKYGFEIDRFVAHQFNGRREVKVSQVRILYAENSRPEDVARAIVAVQKNLYETMSRYAQQPVASTPK